MAELIALWARKDLKETEPKLAGYLPEERREVER
jgi:hypothetical protein